jgi:hypothetical protein
VARPKRIGAFSALDESLAGPVASWLSGERIPHPVQVGRATKQRRAGSNALDDLLPGPDDAEAPAEAADAPRARRHRQVGRNALDDLLPGPDPGVATEPPPRRSRSRSGGRSHGGERRRKVWVNFELPADVLAAVTDAVSALSGPPVWMTMGDLAERALRAEVERLAAEHNDGRPFPPQDG